MKKYEPRPVYDMVKFLTDHGIDHSESASTVTSGWVGVHCPFCAGTRNYHLGYNLSKGYWYCWRCKGHSMREVLSAYFAARAREAEAALIRYALAGFERIRGNLARKTREERKALTLPEGSRALNDRAMLYLERRGFDCDRLVRQYDLQCTEAAGAYKYRIIIPFKQRNELVSFQGRDYTGKSDLRYKACAVSNEVVHHKHILYGQDLVPGKAVVVVEGVADAWKLGPGAVATCGITYTKPQLRLLAMYQRVFIFLDNDPNVVVVPESAPHAEFERYHESRTAAMAMARQLSLLGVDTYLIPLMNYADPGEIPEQEAHELMRELIR